MFAYCTGILNLSEHEAYLRIAVARAARRHRMLLEMLADGRLHLSGIAVLAPHLTEENRDAVLARAARKSKRQIEELVAELAPKPDAPASTRKLPRPSTNRRVSEPLSDVVRASERLGPDRVESEALIPTPHHSTVEPLAAARVALRTPPRAMEPLAPERYRVQFTASAELHAKLERLQKLMRTSVPGGDLAAVIEAAVTEKLERLETRRYGTTRAPRKRLAETSTSASSRHVPAAVRRSGVRARSAACAYSHMMPSDDARRPARSLAPARIPSLEQPAIGLVPSTHEAARDARSVVAGFLDDHVVRRGD